MEALKYILVLLAAYLLGGISFSYLVGRLVRGVDLRELGSGNLGGTNVMRQVGPVWGAAVLLLDFAKGWVTVALAARLLGAGPWPVLSGLAAILGHSFTPYLGFRGGKGVAVSTGVFVYLAPFATGLALLVFLLTMLLTRIVSAGSLVAALALPIILLWRGRADRWVLGFSILATILIWLRHRGNLSRLLRGKEPRFRFSKEGGE